MLKIKGKKYQALLGVLKMRRTYSAPCIVITQVGGFWVIVKHFDLSFATINSCFLVKIAR
jgi:hypothetical protein